MFRSVGLESHQHGPALKEALHLEASVNELQDWLWTDSCKGSTRFQGSGIGLVYTVSIFRACMPFRKFSEGSNTVSSRLVT